ncbi:MAG TPA: LuxR C-terminal-related transcriptional regulator [Streptosporangiaceae bacterium]|nr:LuxR C-terminal-related transcriptional regulator [Streptosporangiaceae bacterium]
MTSPRDQWPEGWRLAGDAPSAGDSRNRRFVGRRTELREISARAASAAAGTRQTVVIEGRPGIGKTALLARALEQLAGFSALFADCAMGDAAEQLMMQLTAQSRASLPRSRAGLLSALRSALEGSAPVAIALDNVHWIDPESAAEFSATLPALRSAALLVLVAAREPWLPDPGAEPEADLFRQQLLGAGNVYHLALAELSVAEVGQVLDQAGPGRPELAAVRLHRYTGGHPALMSVLLDQGLAIEHASPADLLGLFDPLVTGFLHAVSALPPPSRDLLAAMAVSDEPWPLAILGSVAGVDDPFAALEPLLDAGLVQWHPAEAVAPVSIKYPLYRDVIYRSLPMALRESLHTRAASFAIGTRAWAHQVAASTDGEPALAAMLVEEAERYYVAGDSERAGRLLIWSVTVTADPRERENLLVQAARWWLTLRAVDWGPRLESCLSRWPQSAPRSLALAVLAEAAGHYAQAYALLTEARDIAERSMLALRPDIDLAMALLHADLGEAEAEYQAAQTLLALGDLPGVHRSWAEYCAVDGWSRINGPEAALDKLGTLVAEADIDGHGGDGRQAGSQSVRLWTRGSLRLLSGRLRDGIEDLIRMLRAGDRAAVDSVAPMAQAYLGYAHYLLGNWQAAQEVAGQALAALTGHAVRRLRVPVHAIAACVDAAAGRSESAARHLMAAQRWLAECGPKDYVVFPVIAAATVAQAHGEYGRMLIALQPLLADPALCRSYQAWWQPLHVEGLIGTGQLSAAQHALGRLADLSDVTGHLAATVAWLDAWLAAAGHDELRARACFDHATAHPLGRDDVPLHRARVEHEYGRYLMSRRNRRAAIERLRRAYEQYRALGARPFAERCASDLETFGAQAPSPAGLPRGEAFAALSPRERRIAYLAAQGLTNQEIAGEIFISAKTVEYHLGKVFAKLGISSRRQLAARMGGESGPGDRRPG